LIHVAGRTRAAVWEFFTEQEAAAFVKFAREHLNIPQLMVTPMIAPSTKSYEDRNVEAGYRPSILLVGDKNADFGVDCFES
jgi:hypothetical protein